MFTPFVNAREGCYLFVELPENHQHLTLTQYRTPKGLTGRQALACLVPNDTIGVYQELPKGNYYLIGTVARMSEASKRPVVDALGDGYANYTHPEKGPLPTASESFATLLEYLKVCEYFAILRYLG